jgi:DNA-binding transcriptional ArsR family regulator
MTTHKPSPPDKTPDEKAFPRRPPEVDKYVDTFLSLVCDTSRRYILELLAIPDEGGDVDTPEKRSGDIARAIGLSAATTSEHLRQLTKHGLISSRREGNVVYYRLRNHELVKSFHDLVIALDHHYTHGLEIS